MNLLVSRAALDSNRFYQNAPQPPPPLPTPPYRRLASFAPARAAAATALAPWSWPGVPTPAGLPPPAALLCCLRVRGSGSAAGFLFFWRYGINRRHIDSIAQQCDLQTATVAAGQWYTEPLLGGIYKNFQYLYEWHSSVTALVQPNIWLFQGTLRVHFG